MRIGIGQTLHQSELFAVSLYLSSSAKFLAEDMYLRDVAMIALPRDACRLSPDFSLSGGPGQFLKVPERFIVSSEKKIVSGFVPEHRFRRRDLSHKNCRKQKPQQQSHKRDRLARNVGQRHVLPR